MLYSEIFLCKYGELALKGLNKSKFEGLLIREIKSRIAPFGAFSVTASQSTIYIEPEAPVSGETSEAVFAALKKIFGLSTVCRAAKTEKDMDKIRQVVREYIPPLIEGKKSFRASAKRADKRFPLKSPEISVLAGEALLEATAGGLSVCLDAPDVTVTVEIRETHAFVHADADKGAGGMPLGSAGRTMLLLSGGIDSPVAGYMMAKRGARVEAVHFESFPYTTEAAKEKVLELARIMTDYCGKMRVSVISVTEIQERLRDTVDEEYFTLLLRRCMMRLAARTARDRHCDALITGESLGQVASQTMAAMNVTDPAAGMLVFRPCIGLDKEEIIQTARRINTFETSVLPYEDCCTVFTPKHPRTRPTLEKVLLQEMRADLSALEDEAYSKLEVFEIDN